jgi:putative ABC transport system ATP-binding protein
MVLLEMRDVRKTYRIGNEDVHALDGVSLEIDQGEFVSVMGRSGSGKSTLLNMMGCLDRPTSGTIVIAGIDTTSLSGSKLADIRSRKIGFVFQAQNLISTSTALENVMLPMKYAHMDNRKRRAAQALERVGLADRMRHRGDELSGGQRQRVAIARALVTEPAIVLADEPTGQLDSKLSAQVIDLMRQLNGELGQTFVIVTHDPIVAEQTDRTIYLSDGRIDQEVRRAPESISERNGATRDLVPV